MEMATQNLLVVFAVVVIGQVQSGDNDGIFTSNADLEQLLRTEAELAAEMKSYLATEEAKIARLKSQMAEYERLKNSASAVGTEEFVGNPLNAFRLIKMMTADWKRVVETIDDNSGKENLLNLTLEANFPSDEDLNGAATALSRLQDTYKLKTTDLADGRLNGVEYGPSLTAEECFELGKQAYNSGDHDNADDWMKEALRKMDDGDASVTKTDVLEYMAFSAYIQANYRRALKITDELLALDPEHPRAAGNRDYYINALESEGGAILKKGEDLLGDADDAGSFTVLEQKAPPDEENNEERSLYKRLCRGENFLSDEYKAKLSCRYYHGKHPFLKLGPVKEELMHLKPRIVVYHDVVSDSEIETIKSMATPRFKRATVQNYKTGELETASYRISKTAWLKREESYDIDRIYDRVADVTGLNMETSEELQVSNYGIGGHYEPHFDFARREEKNAFASLGTGNRIATWLFYESDVDQGGATVFPHLGIGLWPKKGSAVFWYNLHRNGEGDDLTRHAACPVLAGSKWGKCPYGRRGY